MLKNASIRNRIAFVFALVSLMVGIAAIGTAYVSANLVDNAREVKSLAEQALLANGNASAGTLGALRAALDNSDSAARSLRHVLFTLEIISELAIGTMLFYVTSSITRPVKRFMDTLDEVARCNLTVKAAVDSRDEIGHLGRSLNDALEILRESLGSINLHSRTVASGAMELSASAVEMSSTTQEIARSGETLHEATDSVTAAIVEFMASVDQVAENVKASIQVTGEAVTAADAGAAGTRETAEHMDRINEVSTSISKVVTVIREIAQQTNLLSLNAAIEAAKAGSNGKGFAVVAEEVRKLAERSRQATVEIESLIQETQGVVDGGMMSVKTTSGLVDRIRQSIANVSGRMAEIGAATREQAATASEIAKRMEESAREVGQNASATHELSAAVLEISRTASNLAHASETTTAAVGKFKIT